MEESGSSRWALVIRDDGEASVVPLSDVPVIQQEGTAGADKNPTVIVLQTQERDEATSCCSVAPNVTEGIAGDGGGTERPRTNAENITNFISLSGDQVEGSVDHLGGTVITIADASEPLATIGSESLENIEISVLAHEETAHTIHANELNRDIPKKPEPKEDVECSTAGCDNGTNTKMIADSKRRGDDTQEARREHLGYKQVENKDDVEDQKKENFCTSFNRWARKLAYCDDVVEPFEKMEATLHKDLISELGLASDSGIFISLHQQGIARGVRVTETSPDQIVVSGSLVELLASRDMILLEIQKIRGLPVLPQLSVPAGTREVGVMCELIPSPPTARYASSLGLDRSARRYHSVLSRPLSPEPRPQRRRPRKHMLSHSKVRNSDKHHILRSYSERIYNKQLHHETDRNGECNIKIEKESEDTVSRRNCVNSQEQSPSVEILFGNLKTEPECDETIIVSNIGDAEVRTIDRGSMSDTKSVVVNKLDDGFSLSSITKDTVLKPLDDRGVQFGGCEVVEGSNNKENIDDTIYVNKAKEKDEEEEEEEGIDMDLENDKMICEPEISMSEGLEDDMSKDPSNDQVKFKFSCKICSYKSMRENHFVKHMQLHDKGLALYRCNECNFVSIRASHLRRHKMSHAQQVLNCHLCAYTCDDQKLLTKHMRAKHQTSKQPKPIGSVFECDECEYKTSWHYAYQRHRRTHSPSKMVVMHTCPQCSYKTMRREHFLRHIKNVHQNCRPFLCDICGKAFKRQDALKQHYVSHYQNLAEGSSGQVGPYGFVCHICQKVCRSATYLKEHMATHSEERSFLCEVCGASFKTRSVQRNHVQTIHRRPRAFTCPACEKKFNTKFALRRHMKQHDAK
ncbi:zinc finger Y-chromosomal protein 1-like [Homarus americanus]|uniref:zinc finger Y-chromosomal protein 1-like n=1 Tax=Homarus americanus TaxID=6706 RepID=UPI001C46BBD8|nr:zinc finger Y-chromosomal protein 1-like [Homarus americanus]